MYFLCGLVDISLHLISFIHFFIEVCQQNQFIYTISMLELYNFLMPSFGRWADAYFSVCSAGSTMFFSCSTLCLSIKPCLIKLGWGETEGKMLGWRLESLPNDTNICVRVCVRLNCQARSLGTAWVQQSIKKCTFSDLNKEKYIPLNMCIDTIHGSYNKLKNTI